MTCSAMIGRYGLLISSAYCFSGDAGQFLHGLTAMSLSKMELYSDAMLIKDYIPSIRETMPYRIFGRPRVSGESGK